MKYVSLIVSKAENRCTISPLVAALFTILLSGGLPSVAKASDSLINICNYGHDDTLYFAAGSRNPDSTFPFEANGWYSARPGTCMRIGRYRGEKLVNLSFAVKNSSGDLIPVIATSNVSNTSYQSDLGSVCASRDEGDFDRARPAADGCPDAQMPVPVSFVLLTEQRYSGPDLIFDVAVRPKNGSFDLSAMPPQLQPSAPLPNFDENKEVSPVVCNHSAGRIRVTTRSFTGFSFTDVPSVEELGLHDCMRPSSVPEGSEIEFLVEEPGNFDKYQPVLTTDDGSFLSNQYMQGGSNQSGEPTSFSVVMATRSGSEFYISITGARGETRVISGEF